MIKVLPTVSILIPAFNCSEWIDASIQSALDQTYPKVEIIVIDDGSSDDTFAKAKKYVSDKVLVETQNNSGASSARNHALKYAHGDWVQFLDADDVLDPKKIELQMELARINGSRFLYSADWGRFRDDISEAKFAESELLADMQPIEWLIKKYHTHDMVQPGAWLVHRDLISEAGMWDVRLSLNDDGEFFDRLIMHSDGVRYVSGAKAYYRTHISGNLSARENKSAAISALLAIDLCTARLLAKDSSIKALKACASQYQRYAYQFYPKHELLAEHAYAKALSLGLEDIPFPGSEAARKISRFLGWRKTRMLQYYYYRMRYKHSF